MAKYYFSRIILGKSLAVNHHTTSHLVHWATLKDKYSSIYLFILTKRRKPIYICIYTYHYTYYIYLAILILTNNKVNVYINKVKLHKHPMSFKSGIHNTVLKLCKIRPLSFSFRRWWLPEFKHEPSLRSVLWIDSVFGVRVHLFSFALKSTLKL